MCVLSIVKSSWYKGAASVPLGNVKTFQFFSASFTACSLADECFVLMSLLLRHMF